jgi:phosphoglycolate phosphatase
MEIDAAAEGSLLDGTRTLLKELQGRAIRIGVVTRNCRAAVIRVFPDIGGFCQAVLTREDPLHVKPHPDHLKAALKELGVPPSESVMVGDHPMDIHLGRAAGADTIGVLTGHSGREAFLLAKADLILEKAHDIIDIIR